MVRAIDRLMAQIGRCRVCVEAPKGRPLPHEPRPVLRISATARVVICGQAPGTRVHASGMPFTDPSGVRLRDWMAVSEEEFYDTSRVAIVPMGFCFPGLDAKGGDLPPRRECAAQWREQVFAQLGKVDLVLLVGQYAQKWHLGADCGRTLSETVADWRRYAEMRPRYLPLPHPSWRNNAWLKKNPWFEDEVLPFLRREVGSLLRPTSPNAGR